MLGTVHWVSASLALLVGLFQLATHVPLRTEAFRATCLLTIVLAAWLLTSPCG